MPVCALDSHVRSGAIRRSGCMTRTAQTPKDLQTIARPTALHGLRRGTGKAGKDSQLERSDARASENGKAKSPLVTIAEAESEPGE